MVKKRKREEASCEVGDDGEEGEEREEGEDVDEDDEGRRHDSKESLASSTTTNDTETPVVCKSDDEALELLNKGCYNFVLGPSVDWFKISGDRTDQELDAIFRALEAPNRIKDIDFCKFE